MNNKRRREIRCFVAVSLAVFLISGCAGFKPYEPRDERVEGPKRGLFSGEAGEFVIYKR
jgi:hypothetical protein